MKKICILLFLFVFFNGASFGEDYRTKGMISKKKTELNSVKKKIRAKKRKIDAFAKREHSIISELNRKEKSLSDENMEVQSIAGSIEEVKKEIMSADSRISKLEKNMEICDSRVKEHLIEMYKKREPRFTDVLFASQSHNDILQNRKSMGVIIHHDLKMMREYGNDLSAVKKKKEELHTDEKRLAFIKEEKERLQSEITRNIAKKAEILKTIRKNKRANMALLKKLKRNSKKLQSMVEKLDRKMSRKAKKEKTARKEYGFAGLMGKLETPVPGKVLPLFGKKENPLLNTFTFGKGVDILAPMGSEIRAVYDGEVLYSDWFNGYGKIIIIDHGNSYYTLFAHASELLKRVGDRVTKGEVVALVGDTDSTKGPHLYFEIRHHGKPQDPVKWLAMPVER